MKRPLNSNSVMSSNEGGEITSDEDRERVIGRAMLEYSEAKKALATFRVQFVLAII